mgnify:CR=1 FL=1
MAAEKCCTFEAMKPETHTCYLLLGSNLGDKRGKISRAIREIETQIGSVVKQSSYYASEPWGFEASDDFINVVVEVKTYLKPAEILLKILEIEKEAGRNRSRSQAYASRVLDVDILFYDDLIMETGDLSIPHPRLQRRRFTLVPLTEIAPGLVHPLFKKSVAALLEECTDKLFVKKNENQ